MSFGFYTSYACTLNGAKTHSTTSDACLDFFAVAGGMRYRSRRSQICLFDRAYIENPELAMKLLFHIRDIRRGMGERELFRTLFVHVACTWPESARKNLVHIPTFGRWDDLLCLLDSPLQEEMVGVIKDQLSRDEASLLSRKNGDKDAPISLLAKWLPSENTSSQQTRKQARELMFALGLSPREYRRRVSALRARIGLTERALSSKAPEKVNYEAVPSKAMLQYRSAFERVDCKRFEEYLQNVAEGTKKINAEGLFPYEILRPFFNEKNGWEILDGQRLLEQLWSHLPGNIGNANAISVVDTSGSMYCSDGPLLPALVSQAMGLYCAERSTGAFHNLLITFDSTPHLVEIHGETLADKLRYLETLPCGGSTNLEAVFALILRTAVKNHVGQEEMPQVLYIFSDMEFNKCMRNADETVYENARRLYHFFGYEMPAVVFHNVNSWQMQSPVRADTKGTALSSGAATSTMGYSFNGNITPMDHMLRVLNSARYAMIHA